MQFLLPFLFWAAVASAPTDTIAHIPTGHVMVCGHYLPPPHVLEVRDSLVVLDGIRVWPMPCRSLVPQPPPPKRSPDAWDVVSEEAGEAVREARARGDSTTPACTIMAGVFRSNAMVDSVEQPIPEILHVWFNGSTRPRGVKIVHIERSEADRPANRARAEFRIFAAALEYGYIMLIADGDESDVPRAQVPVVLSDIERVRAGLEPTRPDLLSPRLIDAIRTPSPVESIGGER